MTFGSEFAKNNVTSTKNYTQPVFFDKKNQPGTPYSELNGVIVPTPSMIHDIQLEKIRIIQQNAWNQRSKQNKKLNKLFESGEINNLPNFYLDGQESTLGDVILKLVNLISSFGIGGRRKVKDTNSEATYKQWNTKFQNLYNLLTNLQSQLSISSTTYQNYLDEIQSAMQACNLGDAGIGTIKEWAKSIYLFQGDVVEAIGTAWLNKHKIPNIETITLGNVSLKGTSGVNGRHNGQLIMDMLTVNYQNVNLEEEEITYITADGEKITTNLKNFFKILETASNSADERIALDDDAYEVLLGLSALNIQAKSGKNQLPWNVQLKSKIAATSASIQEFDPSISSGIGIVRAFELLHTLNQDEDLDIVDKSADYNALANYGLSTMLAKILHLSGIEGNQMLLTPSGFISYTDRMEQLFKDGNDYVKFVEDITLNKDTLGTSYHTTIASKPKGY